MAELIFDSEEVRSIIRNAHKILRHNKCIECNGTGYTNWNEDGNDIKPGIPSDIDRDYGECEECEGVGYTDLLMY